MDFKDRQFKWHCEFGIPENMDKLREEFNLYRNLKPIKIIVSGPPSSGKTTLCTFLTSKYKLNNYNLNQFCDWAKNLNNPLGEEVKQKLLEIEENIIDKTFEINEISFKIEQFILKLESTLLIYIFKFTNNITLGLQTSITKVHPIFLSFIDSLKKNYIIK